MYSGLFIYVSFWVVIGIEVIAGYSLWSQSQWGVFIHRRLTPEKKKNVSPLPFQIYKVQANWRDSGRGKDILKRDIC